MKNNASDVHLSAIKCNILPIFLVIFCTYFPKLHLPAMKVTAILKGMIDQNGHQPIQIRISDRGKQSFVPTKIKVDPSLFEKGKVSAKHPKAKEYNQLIQTLIIQHQANAIQGIIKRPQRIELFEYINRLILHWDRKGSTLKLYKSQIKKLKGFTETVYLEQINHDWLNQYKAYLKARGNDSNTVWAAFKFLKTFINHAVRDGILQTSPLRNYQLPKYQNPTRTYLTEDEVRKLDKFIKRKDLPAEVRDAALCFLIGCYSGLRVSDLKAFDKKKHIIGGRLVMQTIKTGEVIGLPVEGKLKKYLELADYKPLKVVDVTYNKMLKVVAAAAGISKHLTAHVSRHTAAMLLANAGVPIEVTAAILGQRSLKTTAIYYKISNKRIDDEIRKVRV